MPTATAASTQTTLTVDEFIQKLSKYNIMGRTSQTRIDVESFIESGAKFNEPKEFKQIVNGRTPIQQARNYKQNVYNYCRQMGYNIKVGTRANTVYLINMDKVTAAEVTKLRNAGILRNH